MIDKRNLPVQTFPYARQDCHLQYTCNILYKSFLLLSTLALLEIHEDETDTVIKEFDEGKNLNSNILP